MVFKPNLWAILGKDEPVSRPIGVGTALMPLTSRSMRNYGLAIAAVLTALLLMLALDPYIYLTRASFLLFFGAVTVAALYGGRGPGTVATLLSALFASYFFIDERYSLNFNFPDGMRLLLFVLQGLLISALVGALQQSQQQTRYSLHRLQNSEAEIKALNQALQQQVVELRAAREQAEAANRIKDEFLAVLSHELRSPLNPILGWVKLLRSNKLDPAKVSYALDTIERNAKLQALLVEDLLDVSRVLRGRMALNIHSVDLPAVIEAAVETTRFSAEAKGIQIKTSLDAEIDPVAGDAARLQQIVWNLLSNAIKFTPAGGQVEIRLERAELEEKWGSPGVRALASEGAREQRSRGIEESYTPYPFLHFPAGLSYAQITVTDTGEGISPSFLPHVFDYFRQADSTTTRHFGGLGLGLAIARHVAELHGGTITAESAGVGRGATFTLRLPLLKQRVSPAPAQRVLECTLS